MPDIRKNYFQRRTKDRGPRSNNRITSPDVQVISSDGDNLGILNTTEAIRKAKPVLLEPVMEVEVVTPGDYLGEVMGDLNSRRAQIRNVDNQGDTQIVTAYVPLAETFGYTTQLRSLTQGRASQSMQFDHYEVDPTGAAAQATAKV